MWTYYHTLWGRFSNLPVLLAPTCSRAIAMTTTIADFYFRRYFPPKANLSNSVGPNPDPSFVESCRDCCLQAQAHTANFCSPARSADYSAAISKRSSGMKPFAEFCHRDDLRRSSCGTAKTGRLENLPHCGILNQL